MRLTKPAAIAMAKAFAIWCVEFDVQRGVHQPADDFDCVAIEESDLYEAFIEEHWPDPRDYAIVEMDPMYQVFRKTLYAEAKIQAAIREEMKRLDYSWEDVEAMHESLEGAELLDMLIGAEPAETE